MFEFSGNKDSKGIQINERLDLSNHLFGNHESKTDGETD